MSNVPMPTRTAFSVDGSLFWEGEHRHGESHDLITTTQAQAYADARVREALEAAKELADWVEHEVGVDPELTPGLQAIRALIPE